MTDPDQTEILVSACNQKSPVALGVEYFKPSDRWAHRIGIIVDDDFREFAVSQEGGPKDVWPASAAIQELSRHSLEAGDALLGVGMAGTSHWSSSTRLIQESVHHAPEFVIEFACLNKGTEPCGWMGSRYDLNADAIVSKNENGLIITLSEQTIQLETLADTQWGTSLEMNGSELCIQPTQVSNSPVVATRWGFAIKPCI